MLGESIAMTEDQAQRPQSDGHPREQREWRIAPIAYGGILLTVFVGTWLVALAAADPARSGRLLVFLLGILVGTLWSLRASMPLLNSPNRTTAAVAWAGLAVASMVALSAAPAPVVERAASPPAGTSAGALKPAPPTAVRREGTVVAIGTPRPTVASSPIRATPRPTLAATAARPAPEQAASPSATPAVATAESANGAGQPGPAEPAPSEARPAAPSITSPPTPVDAPTRSPIISTPPSGSPTPTPLPDGLDPGRFLGQGTQFECSDIPSQAEAQAVLRADPTDPNVLDRDRDGIACETNPPPRDARRVPRPAP